MSHLGCLGTFGFIQCFLFVVSLTIRRTTPSDNRSLAVVNSTRKVYMVVLLGGAAMFGLAFAAVEHAKEAHVRRIHTMTEGEGGSESVNVLKGLDGGVGLAVRAVGLDGANL